MQINEQYKNLTLLSEQTYTFAGRDGRSVTEQEAVLNEHLIDVYVNEMLTMKLTCIPEHLTELVLGRLLTEGIIGSAEDVDTIYICEFGSRARVMLKETAAQQVTPPDSSDYVEKTPTCCTGNHILNDFFVRHSDTAPVVPIHWEKEWIFDLADRFADGTPLHKQTFATHSCFLSMNGELLFSCEDIGRHNALDKAIGFALRQGIDLKQCIVYSSGRIPVDMTEKAVRAGIPVLASKASPSFEAVELAKQFSLTLICAARRDRMKIFSAPDSFLPKE